MKEKKRKSTLEFRALKFQNSPHGNHLTTYDLRAHLRLIRFFLERK